MNAAPFSFSTQFGSGLPVRLLLGGTLLLAGLSAVCSLWWPYGWDQGCFSYVAQIILGGGEPYRDAWDFKGPLTFYVFAALQLLFGQQMWAVRVLDLCVVAGGCAAVFGLVRRLADRATAWWTVSLLVLAHYGFGNWYTAQPDDWASWLLAAGVAWLCHSPRPARSSVAGFGLIVGLCCLIKPVYGLFLSLGMIALWPSWSPATEGLERAAGSVRREALLQAGGMLGLFVAPIAIAAGWFALRGVFAELIDVYVRFSLERLATDPAMHMPLRKVLANGQAMLLETPSFAAALPASGVGLVSLWVKDRRRAAILGSWPVLALAIIMIQRKFWFNNYTWHALYPALSVLTALGLHALWEMTQEHGRHVARVLVVLILVILARHLGRPALEQVPRWVSLLRGACDLATYREQFDLNVPALRGGSAADVGFGVARDQRIAAYLRGRTGANDRLMVWGDPLVNYLAERVSITPVTLAQAFTTLGRTERRARHRDELLRRLASPEARYIGVTERDLAPGEDDSNLPKYFPELLAAIEQHYAYETTIGDVRLFRRRPVSVSAP